MNVALLTTKLYIPTVRHNLVTHPRLTAKLNECVERRDGVMPG